MLKPDLPCYDDLEGDSLPKGFSRVIDAHVHVFPDLIFQAVRDWFDEHAWKTRYREKSQDLIAFLLDHGVGHVVALQYAHKPGIADFLNEYMIDIQNRFPGRVTGMATIFPGEDRAREILDRAFEKGLGGVKLHVHVQCFDMDSFEMDEVCDICRDQGKPLVIHAGTEPKSEQYRCDPYELCRADKVERILKNFPGLKICVPHLGFGEITEYKHLAERYDNLWLDTAMVLTDYFPLPEKPDLSTYRKDRIMYGSDFPNIPYAWDRELIWLRDSKVSSEDLEKILYKNALRFFDIQRIPENA
ncbi:amidohydrolase family protein [Desulfospira joergensenii]|uniref:amidohydrolase family protein n=1 Tax=Desulfospira joergensenii TaxID=53329 RepID=UPI0003B5458D|nr:amidohydrolase family protein [Desulfospira joergensenii]